LRVPTPGVNRIAERSVPGGQEGVGGDDAREAFRVLGRQPEADEAAPVLRDQRHLPQVESEENTAHPVDVALVGVVLAANRLVGTPEADQVRCHDPVSGRHQDGDHLAVEVRPGRLAVQAEDGVRARRSLVDVVDPEPVDVEVVRAERVAWKTHEAIVGGAEALEHRGPSLFALIGESESGRNNPLAPRRSLTAREAASYNPPACWQSLHPARWRPRWWRC